MGPGQGLTWAEPRTLWREVPGPPKALGKSLRRQLVASPQIQAWELAGGGLGDRKEGPWR